jgi:hypothetical protein
MTRKAKEAAGQDQGQLESEVEAGKIETAEAEDMDITTEIFTMIQEEKEFLIIAR